MSRRQCWRNVQDGVAETKAMVDRFNEISTELADPDADYDTLLAEMGKLQEAIDHKNVPGTSTLSWTRPWTRCGVPTATRTSRCCPVARSVEWRCANCCCRHRIWLLLDEPTNHLDAESVNWLEQYLERYPGTVVAITHDRYFLDNVAEWILELDRGRAYPYQGNYSTYLETKAARMKVEGQKDAKLQSA